MKFVSRMKLNGRRISEIQIVQEISDMIHGTGSRPYSIPVAIVKMLEISRDTKITQNIILKTKNATI